VKGTVLTRVFINTVSALCYSLIARHEGSHRRAGVFPNNEAVSFVVAEWRRAPDFVRAPIFLLTLLLCALSLLSCGRPLYRLDGPQRLRQLQVWHKLRVLRGPELLQFYESLVLLGYYKSLEQQGASQGRTIADS